MSGPVDSSYTDIHSPLPTYLQVVALSIVGIIFELRMIATICVGVFTFHHTTACDARKSEHCHDMLVLRAEVAHATLYFLRQRRKQLRIRLATRRKHSCCVREALRVEVADTALRFPCQRRKQLHIQLAQRRKRPAALVSP